MREFPTWHGKWCLHIFRYPIYQVSILFVADTFLTLAVVKRIRNIEKLRQDDIEAI